jgi:hypothetical protein
MPREAAVLAGVRAELTKRGAWSVKYNPFPYGVRGVPDLLCCYRGVFLGVETKQLGLKPRPDQRAVHREIRDAGGIVCVVETRAAMKAVLDALDLILGTDACEECDGSGEVHWNPSRNNDPQCERDEACGHCGGSGVKPRFVPIEKEA